MSSSDDGNKHFFVIASYPASPFEFTYIYTSPTRIQFMRKSSDRSWIKTNKYDKPDVATMRPLLRMNFLLKRREK